MANAAYQGTRSEDAEALAQWIYELEFTTFGIPKPDVFFVFDIPTSLSRKNVAKKGFRGYVGDDADVYEKDVAFLEKVRNCYLSCAKLYPGSVVLNCADESEEMRPMDEIASDVLRILKEQFNIDI
jgi:dTMP kinase